MNTIYFYIYLIAVITITVTFTIARCIFEMHKLDMFFYPNHDNNIIENYVYLISHIVVNFGLGYLFGFDIIMGMFIKIILFEVFLYITERCDIFNTSKISHLIIIIMISLVSYTLGCFSNIIFNGSGKNI